MTRMDHEVRCMALRQLETACSLYEQQDYYSVITLAGAAEEIFENLLMDKLLKELRLLLIGSSDDTISQLPEKLQKDSSKLTKDLKALKEVTAQFPRVPEETWDKSLNKLTSEARKVLNKLIKDCKKIEDICGELPNDEFLADLKGVFVRNKSSLDSFSVSVTKIAEGLPQSLGEEEDPTESDVRRRANWIRNTLKHWFPGQPNVVEFDAAEEAKDMLDRAIDNYYALTSELTDAMQRFRDMHVHDNKQIRP